LISATQTITIFETIEKSLERIRQKNLIDVIASIGGENESEWHEMIAVDPR
jgi:hypothetical protein